MSYLIRGGVVLTLGERSQNHLEADVLVEDGRIAEIGKGLRSRGAEVVEADGCIVMPGFVDTHRHLWRSLFRHFGGDAGASAQPEKLGLHYGPDDIYTSTLLGLASAAAAGIATVVDWADFAPGTEMKQAAVQAHADSGLRTVLVSAQPSWLSSSEEKPPGLESEPGPLMGNAVGVTTVSANEWEAARESGLRIHAHTRGGSEAMTFGGSQNLLGTDVTLVHGSHLTPEDLDAAASAGAGVSVTPSSEMAGGLGSPSMQALIDRGIRPGLGVGDERLAPGDLFAQMRASNSIQHATMFDLKLSGKAGLPSMLTTREVIRYATADGANAVGLGSVTGSIEVGKRADILVLRADKPNIAPINDPIGAVVWGMDTSNVDWLFVDGVPRVSGGELQHDVPALSQRANSSRDRIAEAAGVSLVGGPQ